MSHFTLSRRSFVLGTAATLALPSISLAKTFGDNGIALNGTDPVAYFTQSQAVKGSADFSTDWNGATWYFSTSETLNMFSENPEKYAPQYGGHCAYAVSKGYLASTDPEAWTIHDDKLYLNYSKLVRTLWARDIPGNVIKADTNWPTLK